MADLLVGSVFGDYTGTTHVVKRRLIEHLKRCLSLSRLTDRRLALARKFTVTIWEPPAATGSHASLREEAAAGCTTAIDRSPTAE